MKLFLGITCATTLLIAIASGQPSSTTATTTTTAKGTETTTTTTESVGVITEFTPGAKIVLSTGTGTGEPVTYKFGKSVTYMNANGKEINASKIRKDRKVRVHYVKEGDDMLVDKVTVVKD